MFYDTLYIESSTPNRPMNAI